MKVVEYIKARDIIVEIQDEHKARVHTTYQMFEKRIVSNPFLISVCKIGYVGNATTREDGKSKKSYNTWRQMLTRCYTEKSFKNNPTYSDCTVCNEWHCYETFETWYNENYYEVEKEYMCLDKDILIKRNRVYSPDTCIFTPASINSMFRKERSSDNPFPTGVYKGYVKNTYKSICRVNGIDKITHGHKTEYDAFLSYKKSKEKALKDVADRYKEKIPCKLYEAIYNWEIEIGE